jgi:hypothetical protein
VDGLTSMRNLYLPDGTWAGQFIDGATAEAWAKKQGYKISECEISTRKVDRGSYRTDQYPSLSDSEYEVVEDNEWEEEEEDASAEAAGESFNNDPHFQQFIQVVDFKTLREF